MRGVADDPVQDRRVAERIEQRCASLNLVNTSSSERSLCSLKSTSLISSLFNTVLVNEFKRQPHRVEARLIVRQRRHATFPDSQMREVILHRPTTCIALFNQLCGVNDASKVSTFGRVSDRLSSSCCLVSTRFM